MRTQGDVEETIRHLFEKIGGDPADLLQIKPIDGDWENALSYKVVRKDGKQTKIYRLHLDDSDEQEMKNALRNFMSNPP